MKRHYIITLTVLLLTLLVQKKYLLANPGNDDAAPQPQDMPLTPEAPETRAIIQNAVKGLVFPDAAEEITVIKPPIANQNGNAALSFPVKIPAGRNYMEPELTIEYSSEGGNGWLGLGWDLSVSAITIETRWGVPRYDPALETETYGMNGMQLSPVAHRSVPVARAAEKQFYPRVEGSFDKVIRHGNSPASYWWEVINKSGIKYFYGGTPALGVDPNAVLTDANNNIAFWALTESRNPNNNFIRYQYAKVSDAGNTGGSPGINLYLSSISYTGHGTTPGKYTVDFIRDRQLSEPKRTDISINAKLGFKKVTADLLRKIAVKYNGQSVRSYELNYIQGAFYKTLLQGIVEYDVAGSLFNTHTFEYFNDVYTDGDKATFSPLSDEQPWNPQNDNVSGDFVTPNLTIFNDKASALSGSKSFGAGFGMALTFGPCGDPVTKTNTAGVAFGVAESSNEGMLALVDINGDGLPDKVFKEGSSLFFRPNQSGPEGVTTFGSKRPINGISDFSQGKSFSSNVGIESHFGIFAGFQISNSDLITSTYFAEANGDQLIDIVKDGVVYFNHLDNSGNPTFTASSDDTPSPINAAAGIDPDMVKIDSVALEKAIDDHPLHDMVKVWVAPFSGTVSITNAVSLIQDPSPDFLADHFRDGVRTVIQFKGTELWSADIAADDFSPKTPTDVNAISVQGGDRIYFRVQSKFNGSFDQVNWAPQITYSSHTAELVDANSLPLYQFSSDNDFLISGPYSTGMAIDGSIHIQGTFTKPVTTDDITIKILKKDSNDVSTTILQQGLPWDQAISLPISIDLDVINGDQFYFSVLSNTNVDWKALQWEPYLFYTASNDPSVTQLVDQNNVPILDFYPTVDFHAFNRLIVRSLAWTGSASDTDTVIVTPKPGFLAGPDTGNLVFSIKKLNVLIAKQNIYVSGGNVSDIHADTVVLFPGEKLYLEYYTDSVRLANTVSSTLAELDTNGTVFDVTCGFHTLDTTILFGPMYRQWGHFAWRGNRDGATQPIIESDLALPPSFTTATDPESIKLGGINDPDDMQSEYDDAGGSNPKNDKFIFLIPDNERKMWRGYDNLSFVKKDILSSSRMGKDNLLPANPISSPSAAGSGAVGISKVSEALNLSLAAGAGPGGASVSTGNTKFIFEYKDMNGDGYPDILANSLVQYTLPFGGLEANARSPFSGEVGYSEHTAGGVTLGGTFVLSRAANATPNSRGARAKASEGDAKISAGLSGDFSYNTDHTLFGWMDINSDGLPDRVHEDGMVELNLGYSFLPAEPWGFSGIGAGDETSIGAGLGINIANYSIAAGIGLSRSLTQSKQTLEDVNGDGLLDYIEDIDPLKIRINTGNGFAPAVEWTGAPKINETVSTGESANGAFTVGVNFFPCLKIAFNPSVQVSQGVNRNTMQLADINGDGFPDFLRSDADNNLMVSLSTINKTNMLKKVNRPLRASFTVDYRRAGNTYSMPNSIFTLANVAVYDGVPGDGADTMCNTFSYQNGFFNRNERDFFGFAGVKTFNLDTRSNNSIYRVVENEFFMDNFYEKGLPKSETVKNAAGDMFTETRHTFQLKDIHTGLSLPNSFKQSDDSAAFPALINIDRSFYEGQAAAGKSTGISYIYDVLGNITSSTDVGDPGPADDLTTNTAYHSIPAKYILNIPSSVTIVSGAQIYRQEATTIDNSTGNVTERRQYLESGDIAKSNMVYDSYGNITKITRPQNLTGQRLSYDYEYDGNVQTFNTKTTDSYGYSSNSTYDFRFGQLLSSTDMNGQNTEYALDQAGRLSKLTGPFEIASGKPFTISYEYHPDAIVPWASARHYDPANPGNDIETVRFCDGLGREVQSKKDIALFVSAPAADQEVMQVSGANTYDAFGRVDSLYYPITEAKGTAGVLNLLTDNISPTLLTYDIMDRVLITTRPDQTVSTMEYGFGPDRDGIIQFKTKAIDGNGIAYEKYTNVRNLIKAVKAQHSQGSDVWTSNDYNAMDELVKVTEDMGNSVLATYDRMGRKTSLNHPDAGLTTYQYDLNDNPVQVVTANLITGNGIKYSYDRERLIKITYPKNPKNNVTLIYGAPGATFNRAGRVSRQTEATGSQEFFYNPLGDPVKNIRVIVLPDTVPLTFTTQWTYDTWSRLTGMIYPDAETLTYNYNVGGMLASMSGVKGATTYNYLTKKGYDKFEQRVFMRYGNATEMTYAYEADRRRLKILAAKTAGNRVIMNNTYSFDKEDNILRIVNSAPLPNSNLMGGKSDYQYTYDDLYRLTGTVGDYKDTTHQNRYTLNMNYNSVFAILNKNQLHQFKGVTDNAWSPRNQTTYNYNYNYNPGEKPHAPVQIGDANFTYDAVGNQTGFTNIVSAQQRVIEWDEENRIKSITDNGQNFRYSYDASGHRVYKSIGQGQQVKVNGKLVTVGGTGNFRIYVNPYMEVRSGSFTKHFYIEDGRITSKYVEGRNPPNNLEGFQFYFHSDHVGNSSFITDRLGEVYQHLEYFPYGETFIDEHGNQERTRYLYNGKERDDETGLYYYGARYYDPRTSVWESVDPLINKTSNMSPYVYCSDNPIKMYDPDGRSAKAVMGGTAKLGDKVYKKVTVQQTMIFYGGASSETLSNKIADKVEKSWNDAHAIIRINEKGEVVDKGGTEYLVVFEVTPKTVSEAKAEEMAKGNQDITQNFVRVEKRGSDKASAVSSDAKKGGGNVFFLNTNDKLEESNTAAHENGHGLGLKHTNHDVYVPTKAHAENIMSPQGDLDIYYGKPGIDNRSVSANNVKDIFKYKKFRNKEVELGSITSNRLFDNQKKLAGDSK